ncbi:unnamed protein product [Rhizoctonia solani]|uniref:Uncharacterized protein n=1 Tax=Rhizoctonia solani TaxID=456999 RepID=A0A8H2XMM5_9AGAM|nr:unnamed protein product [Rhizoctonia solani]
MSEPNKFIDWDKYVHSKDFDRACEIQSQGLSSGFSSSTLSSFGTSSSNSSISNSYGDLKLWDDLTWVDSSNHGVGKLEAYLYYYGLRGNRHPGPKLVYRTSTDIFSPPSGPSQDLRMMQMLTVHDHAQLSQDLWAMTAEILDHKKIKYTSIDLVRFCWKEDGKTITSAVTIWIGVRPDSTNGDAAFNSTQDIFKLLEGHGIDCIDIAYRESESQPLSGPILYPPVSNAHWLKSVFDWVTTPLSLPIAGLKTLDKQGTLGFYFKMGEDLYGVTARHVLFPDTEGNEPYSYMPAAPKKHVVLMGNNAFDELLSSVKDLSLILKDSVSSLEGSIKTQEAKVQGGSQQAVTELAIFQQQLDYANRTILELKTFFATLKKDWSDPKDRVIGHIVWSPPIAWKTPSHDYTQDVCVIKLDKDKFLPNFRGNALDLGTEIDPGKFKRLMYPRYDVPSEFQYPEDRIYPLRVILSATEINAPNSQDIQGEPARFVFKRGLKTGTTLGRLNGFMSRQRRYGLLGNHDSIEVAVIPYDNNSGPFSRGGDSGAAIVGANNDIIAQLTGGTGPTDSSDISYGTPMEWLWNDVIKAEYSTAVLFFDVTTNN